MKRVEVTFTRRDAGSEDGFTDLFFEAGETVLITKKLADLFGRTGALVPEGENEGGEPPDSGDSEGGSLEDKLSYNSDSGSTETSATIEVNKTL